MMLVDDEGIVADADTPETTHTSIHHGGAGPEEVESQGRDSYS